MNLKYRISLDYDIYLSQAYWEHFLNTGKVIWIPARYFPIVLGLSNLGLIIWGIFEQNVENSASLITAGILSLLLSVFLFFGYRPQGIKIKKLSAINRNSLQKQWSDYYEQQHEINIILTPEEFILESSGSEIAYTWKSFKSLDRYNAGFIISFFDGYQKFIPRLAFSDDEQVHTLKQYIEQYRCNL